MMTGVNFSHPDDDLMKEVQRIISDAEFQILMESNQEVAMTPSGLQYLFDNWSKQQ